MSLGTTEVRCPKCRAWIGEECVEYKSTRTVSSHIAAATGKMMAYVPVPAHGFRVELARAHERGRSIPGSGLRTQILNCLRNEGISWEGQLAGISDAELLRIPNFGRKCLNELRRWQGGVA